MSRDDVDTWPVLANGNILDNLAIAKLIRKIYGPAAELSSGENLELRCQLHQLAYSMDDEKVEEKSIRAYKNMILEYTYGVPLDAKTEHKLAVIFGK